MDTIDRRLGALVREKRILLREFLVDYDRQRTGSISTEHLMRGLRLALDKEWSRLGMSAVEFDALAAAFADARQPGAVRWRDLCRAIDAAAAHAAAAAPSTPTSLVGLSADWDPTAGVDAGSELGGALGSDAARAVRRARDAARAAELGAHVGRRAGVAASSATDEGHASVERALDASIADYQVEVARCERALAEGARGFEALDAARALCADARARLDARLAAVEARLRAIGAHGAGGGGEGGHSFSPRGAALPGTPARELARSLAAEADAARGGRADVDACAAAAVAIERELSDGTRLVDAARAHASHALAVERAVRSLQDGAAGSTVASAGARPGSPFSARSRRAHPPPPTPAPPAPPRPAGELTLSPVRSSARAQECLAAARGAAGAAADAADTLEHEAAEALAARAAATRSVVAELRATREAHAREVRALRATAAELADRRDELDRAAALASRRRELHATRERLPAMPRGGGGGRRAEGGGAPDDVDAALVAELDAIARAREELDGASERLAARGAELDEADRALGAELSATEADLQVQSRLLSAPLGGGGGGGGGREWRSPGEPVDGAAGRRSHAYGPGGGMDGGVDSARSVGVSAGLARSAGERGADDDGGGGYGRGGGGGMVDSMGRLQLADGGGGEAGGDVRARLDAAAPAGSGARATAAAAEQSQSPLRARELTYSRAEAEGAAARAGDERSAQRQQPQPQQQQHPSSGGRAAPPGWAPGSAARGGASASLPYSQYPRSATPPFATADGAHEPPPPSAHTRAAASTGLAYTQHPTSAVPPYAVAEGARGSGGSGGATPRAGAIGAGLDDSELAELVSALDALGAAARVSRVDVRDELRGYDRHRHGTISAEHFDAAMHALFRGRVAGGARGLALARRAFSTPAGLVKWRVFADEVMARAQQLPHTPRQ